MKKIILPVLFAAFFGIVGCDVEESTGEAPIVDAELEEDATLVDDAPIGVMDISTGGDTQPPPLETGTGGVDVPPASEAVQPTPTLTDQ